jgi:hypothetical protein
MKIHLEKIKANNKFNGKKSALGDSAFVKTCDELFIGLHPNFAMAAKPRQPQV